MTGNTKVDYRVWIQLPSKLQEQVNELVGICFDWIWESPQTQADNEDRFYNLKPVRRLTALEGEQVVSYAAIYQRQITYLDKEIGLGGLGGVCTRPDRRRQGLASKLIDMGMAELKKLNCDLAYICTDTADSSSVRLYKKAGFRVLGKPHTYYGKSGQLYTDHDGMIAPVNSEDLFDWVLKGKVPLHLGRGNW